MRLRGGAFLELDGPPFLNEFSWRQVPTPPNSATRIAAGQGRASIIVRDRPFAVRAMIMSLGKAVINRKSFRAACPMVRAEDRLRADGSLRR